MLRWRFAMRMSTMHRRWQVRYQVERRVDEREVGEGLREVAELTLRSRVVLLSQQPDIVREADETVEERHRFVAAAEQLEAVDEPERAREEDSFARREPVDVAFLRAIAEDEAIHDEVLLDRLDGAAHL